MQGGLTLESEYILQAIQVSKRYPGVQALDCVDFSLKRGEVHALVGQNGAGKSTLVEIIAGSIPFDSGEIIIDGKTCRQLDPAASIENGIQTVHQDNQLVEEISVAENIFLYNLPRTKSGFVNISHCVQEANSLLEKLGIKIDSSQKISSLTFVEKKLISIAKAFSRQAQVLILDEPTASLDENGKEVLYNLIRRYSELGLSTIYISHHLNEIFEICDRVTVFKDGKRVDTSDISRIDVHTVVHQMIGKSSDSLYKREKKTIVSEDESTILHFDDFNRGKVVNHVSFSLKPGEIYGLAGLVGSGRTELAQLIFGIDKKEGGTVTLGGSDITPRSPNNAIKKGFGFLTEDRKDSGLVLMHPIRDNITLVDFVKRKSRGLLNLKEELDHASEVTDQLNVKTPSVMQKVVNLSGGNQQKVVLGKWLFAKSNIIIFDEPTVGVDVGSKSEIYKLIDQLASEGKYIIVISSDNPELVSICDRVGIMRFGQLVTELEGDQISVEQILKYSLGVHEAQG
jgi:ABC-type sugar transport system ATPase subunit